MHQFMHHLCLCICIIQILKIAYILCLISLQCSLPLVLCFVLCFLSLYILAMAPKNARKFKSKAKRVSGSFSKPVEVFDQTRFHVFQKFQNFDSLVKYRFIWGERQVNLDDLDHSVFQNLEFRKLIKSFLQKSCTSISIFKLIQIN